MLQKIEGISQPALGQANFDFYFTRKVSKNIGPWPCWYASTFYAVGHASATVNLNPGPAWWAPAAGHYRLQVLSRPAAGKPGHVTVMMVLPRPQPAAVGARHHDRQPSVPPHRHPAQLDLPGVWLRCGAEAPVRTVRAVLAGPADRLLQGHPRAAGDRPADWQRRDEATQTIRGSFIQPTLNALGYTLDQFTLRWAAAAPAAAGQ